jgi:hypothetical protein
MMVIVTEDVNFSFCFCPDQFEGGFKPYQAGCKEREVEVCGQLLSSPWLHLELRSHSSGKVYYIFVDIKNYLCH